MRSIRNLTLITSVLALITSAAMAADGRAFVWSKQTSPGVWQSGWLVLITAAGREKVFVGPNITGDLIEGQLIEVNGKSFVVFNNDFDLMDSY